MVMTPVSGSADDHDQRHDVHARPVDHEHRDRRREQQQHDGEIEAHRHRTRDETTRHGHAAVGGAQPSPQGSPSRYQAASSSVHSTHSTTMYGSISAITVPTPASFWYFCANVTIIAK